MEVLQLPISTWDIIMDHVSVVEQDEIKIILGESDVELSYDLRKEIIALHEIWLELRNSEQPHLSDSEKSGNKLLMENPVMKEMMVKQVASYVNAIKEKVTILGEKEVHKLLATPVCHYVETARSQKPKQRPPSAVSQGRETPLIDSPENISRMNTSLEDINGLHDNMNVYQFHTIVKKLKQFLQEEIVQLKNSISAMQKCIYDENDYCLYAASPPIEREPTMDELAIEKKRLQSAVQDLTHRESVLSSPVVSSNRLNPMRPGNAWKSSADNSPGSSRDSTIISSPPSTRKLAPSQQQPLILNRTTKLPGTVSKASHLPGRLVTPPTSASTKPKIMTNHMSAKQLPVTKASSILKPKPGAHLSSAKQPLILSPSPVGPASEASPPASARKPAHRLLQVKAELTSTPVPTTTT